MAVGGGFMAYVPDWEQLAEALKRVIEASFSRSEAQRDICRAIIDGKIKVRFSFELIKKTILDHRIARKHTRQISKFEHDLYSGVELLSGGSAVYNSPIISVEHVLSQNPAADSHWLTDFPNEADREKWVHKLANLVLLTRRKNSQAGNLDFAEKKSKYFSTKAGLEFRVDQQGSCRNDLDP